MRNKTVAVLMIFVFVMSMFTGCKKYDELAYDVNTGDRINIDFDSKGTDLKIVDNNGYPTVVDAEGNAVFEMEFDTTDHGYTLINMLNDLVTSGVIHKSGMVNGNPFEIYGFDEYTEGEYNTFMVITITGTSTDIVVNSKRAYEDVMENILPRVYFYGGASKRPKTDFRLTDPADVNSEAN